LSTALGGLGEVGTQQDAALTASFLENQSARVRRAAIRAVSRLDAESHLAVLLRALDDPTRSVSSAARNALRPHTSQVGFKTVWGYFESGPFLHTRRNAFELLAALPKWDSVLALLQVVSGHSAFAELATDHLLRWNARYNQSGTMPSSDELRRASAALDAAASRLPPPLASELRFIFASLASHSIQRTL
ncbi:MAG TPA: HEAT repeat domain-containing protein, partial [Thermoanaerobaculia bacterium]